MAGTLICRHVGDAYLRLLAELRTRGSKAPAVTDPMSAASGFGLRNRPAVELLGMQVEIPTGRSGLISSRPVPLNVGYAFGLLAWTLDGRNDVASIDYYRRGTQDFSDDGETLSGAFGARLFRSRAGNQMDAVINRLRHDPGSRRAFAAILEPSDNFVESREYPCAIGVQMFARADNLHVISYMRAQQALTVFSYDVFLFTALQQFAAAELGVGSGRYVHTMGTSHYYAEEEELVDAVLAEGVSVALLPHVPLNRGAQVAAEIVRVERQVRIAAQEGDEATLAKLSAESTDMEWVERARAVYLKQALYRLGVGSPPRLEDVGHAGDHILARRTLSSPREERNDES